MAFSYEDVFVIIAAHSSIFLYDLETKELLSIFRNQVNVDSLLIVPTDTDENCLVAINDSSINIWTWQHVEQNKRNMILYLSMNELHKTDTTKFICGAVTDDGMYLVAATDDYFIRMWNIEDRAIIDEFFNRNGYFNKPLTDYFVPFTLYFFLL